MLEHRDLRSLTAEQKYNLLEQQLIKTNIQHVLEVADLPSPFVDQALRYLRDHIMSRWRPQVQVSFNAVMVPI